MRQFAAKPLIWKGRPNSRSVRTIRPASSSGAVPESPAEQLGGDVYDRNYAVIGHARRPDHAEHADGVLFGLIRRGDDTAGIEHLVAGFLPDKDLNAVGIQALVQQVKDIAALKRIPGLGAKKAERLILELADRLDDVVMAAGGGAGARASAGAAVDEAVHALVALGYNAAEASTAVRKALDESGKLMGIDLIKAALGKVTK